MHVPVLVFMHVHSCAADLKAPSISLLILHAIMRSNYVEAQYYAKYCTLGALSDSTQFQHCHGNSDIRIHTIVGV